MRAAWMPADNRASDLGSRCMSTWCQRAALLAALGVALTLGAAARAQTAASPTAQAASTPAAKHKRASTAKTPPGKPPRGAAHCNEGDKAQRQRCMRDLYGPGAPPG
jgi:hypothetical protein